LADPALALLPEAVVLPALVPPAFALLEPLAGAEAFTGALAAPLDWELCARKGVPPHTSAAHTIPIAIRYVTRSRSLRKW
jgi:hypothetical protein